MAERLPGKIGTEPQYVIKFFAQWKLVIGRITPLTLGAAGERTAQRLLLQPVS